MDKIYEHEVLVDINPYMGKYPTGTGSVVGNHSFEGDFRGKNIGVTRWVNIETSIFKPKDIRVEAWATFEFEEDAELFEQFLLDHKSKMGEFDELNFTQFGYIAKTEIEASHGNI